MYGCLEHGNNILEISWTPLRFCGPGQVILGFEQASQASSRHLWSRHFGEATNGATTQNGMFLWEMSNRRRQPRQLAGVIGGGGQARSKIEPQNLDFEPRKSRFVDSPNDLAWSAKSYLGPGGPQNAIPTFQTAIQSSFQIVGVDTSKSGES